MQQENTSPWVTRVRLSRMNEISELHRQPWTISGLYLYNQPEIRQSVVNGAIEWISGMNYFEGRTEGCQEISGLPVVDWHTLQLTGVYHALYMKLIYSISKARYYCEIFPQYIRSSHIPNWLLIYEKFVEFWYPPIALGFSNNLFSIGNAVSRY